MCMVLAFISKTILVFLKEMIVEDRVTFISFQSEFKMLNNYSNLM